MGKTFKGGSKFEGNAELLTKEQKKFLSSILSSGTSSKAKRSYQRFLEGRIDEPDMMSRKDLDKFLKPSRKTYEDLMGADESMEGFQYGVVDPMMQQYQQRVLPSIQQHYADLNAGSSSALNQALAASANDLTTQMGSMYLPYMQNQQQVRLAAAGGMAGLTTPMLNYASLQQNDYHQQLANRLTALSGVGGLAGQQTFTPIISKHQGIQGPLIGAAGSIGAAALKFAPQIAAAFSSEKVKENIREYSKGLDVVNGLDVKIYDFKPEVGGDKDRVGVIAEKVPKEIQASVSGILGVDLYGLIGLLINSVKELSAKIERLEGKDATANCT